jgi:hypothetical protein
MDLLYLFPVSIIPPLFHACLHLHVAVNQKDKELKAGDPSKEIAVFGYRGVFDKRSLSIYFCSFESFKLLSLTQGAGIAQSV